MRASCEAPLPAIRVTMSSRTRAFLVRSVVALLGLGILAGCGSTPKLDDVVKDRQAEYRESANLPPLEVPPDLTTSSMDDAMAVPDTAAPAGAATYSDYASERPAASRGPRREAVLAAPEGIQVKRDGDQRWLLVPGEPEQYWDEVREFWLENGLLIKTENPGIGIMETDWAENRADLHDGVIRSLLGKVGDFVYSTSTRDKFRTRFERGNQPATTEIYISHRGLEEVEQGDITTVWQPRPADPELEAEMLNRLMVYLGVETREAQRMIVAKPKREVRAVMVRDADGQVALSLKDDFSRAWRRTGLALDRVGFTVEDRDRARGVYLVRYADPLADVKDKGLLSKLFSRDAKPSSVEYQVSLVEQGDTTDVVVLDTEGQRDSSDTAGRILSLLHEQLK